MKATMEKTQDNLPMGEYKRTALDDAKNAADIRIVDVGGPTTTIKSKFPLEDARGITPYTNKLSMLTKVWTYEVTKAAMKKLEAKYTIVTDF